MKGKNSRGRRDPRGWSGELEETKCSAHKHYILFHGRGQRVWRGDILEKQGVDFTAEFL